MSVTLPEELLLIVLDDVAGSVRAGRPALDFGLAGGQLLELALASRIDVVDKKVAVVDPRPVGDPDIDRALERIATSKRQRKPQDWVQALHKPLRAGYSDRLVKQGMVRLENRRVLGIFPVRRFPAVDAAVETETRGRLRSVLVEGADPDPRTAALVSLLRAADMVKKLFPDADRGAIKRRAKEVSEGEWAGAAVRKAVESVNAAVAGAVAAATAAGAASSST
ncbi:MAG: GPP34 family phosphoprotein [Streptosporangiales bacterium]|nr:GPP34 family phosphoprotein [Streptosporangiales bacterium]